MTKLLSLTAIEALPLDAEFSAIYSDLLVDPKAGFINRTPLPIKIKVRNSVRVLEPGESIVNQGKTAVKWTDKVFSTIPVTLAPVSKQAEKEPSQVITSKVAAWVDAPPAEGAKIVTESKKQNEKGPKK